jgi:hypothetical protein
VAGTQKHKGLKLTDAEVADLAATWLAVISTQRATGPSRRAAGPSVLDLLTSAALNPPGGPVRVLFLLCLANVLFIAWTAGSCGAPRPSACRRPAGAELQPIRLRAKQMRQPPPPTCPALDCSPPLRERVFHRSSSRGCGRPNWSGLGSAAAVSQDEVRVGYWVRV